MSRRVVMICVDEQHRWSAWLAGAEEAIVLSERGDASADEACPGIAERLRAEGYDGGGLVLAVPSSWCLCATVKTDGLPRRKQRDQAMLYRLEEKLPLAAEDIAADFTQSNGSALGVAVRLELARPWVEGLERNGVAVQTIAPEVLLATQALVELDEVDRSAAQAAESAAVETSVTSEQPAADLEAAQTVVWATPAGGVEIVRLGGVPIGWSSIDYTDAPLHLRRLSLENGHSLRVVAAGEPDLIRSLLAQVPRLSLAESVPVVPAFAAARAAKAMLGGELDPWFDLRRGPLASEDPLRQVRRPLTFALAMALIFLIALGGGMLWRAARYDRLTQDLADRQRAAFREALPGQAVPAAVRSRLASEEQRLRGVSGSGARVDSGRSALLILRDALSRLPADVRFRLLEMRIEKDRLYLEGQARTHGDADLIAAALRKQQVFEIEAPRTEQLAGQGVSFTITGTLAPPPGRVAQGGQR